MKIERWGYLIPAVAPNVEDNLMQHLKEEVKLYSRNLHGVKCLLCPFRKFNRRIALKEHLKFHCEKNTYMADSHSPQRAVVRALYDYLLSNCPISKVGTNNLNLLHQSATLIAK